jgi:hypothetical protein
VVGQAEPEGVAMEVVQEVLMAVPVQSTEVVAAVEVERIRVITLPQMAELVVRELWLLVTLTQHSAV